MYETSFIRHECNTFLKGGLAMKRNVLNEKALQDSKGSKRTQESNPTGLGRALRQILLTSYAVVIVFYLIGVIVVPGHAQSSYPNKPVRIILPFPPGGSTDILGRIIGQKLSERLGQPVVPEIRPGAAGNVGAEYGARARPDGYTIVFITSGLTTSASLYRKLNYNLIKDFVPISITAQTHQVLIVNPSLPVKNLKEFVEYAKANPGKINFGSTGTGAPGHLASELLKLVTKISIVHVPYKGAGQAMIGLVGGEVDMSIASATGAVPHIQTGKVRALAVLGATRSLALPDVPTAKEAGIGDLDVTTWYGIVAPQGTPRDIVNRLNMEWIRSARMSDTIEMIKKAQLEPLSSTPEEFAELIKNDTERWSKVVKEADIPKID
jgi:tripartite-type tricarboxylate transporter receptor subunit TctC